jgi:prepilin-type processing-associated H-X9-DG protein
MVRPAPAELWVITDENPDSINDASFGVRMDQSVWQDGPGTLHNGGSNFSFADGHTEMKHWTDPRSVSPPMATTYRTTFPFGLTQLGNPDIQWLQDRTTARQ